jgi:UDP:flavonoid glycosyltransferase YjiC (YdhE family)
MDNRLIDILKEMTANGYGVSFSPMLVNDYFRINVSKVFHDGIYHPMHVVEFVPIDDEEAIIEAIRKMANDIMVEFRKYVKSGG